jgi:DNA polymerase III subunit epsilon
MPIDLKIIKYYFWEQFILKYKIRRAQKSPEYEYAVKSINQRPSFNSITGNYDISTCSFTIFDLETTGFFPEIGDEIISIGAVKVKNLEVQHTETFYKVIKPIKKVSRMTKQLTGLDDEDLNKGVFLPGAIDAFWEYCQDTILVAHPASFDINFLQQVSKTWSLPYPSPPYIDSHTLAGSLFELEKNYLDDLIKRYGILPRERHHALNDAVMTAEIFIELLKEDDIKSTMSLDDLESMTHVKATI